MAKKTDSADDSLRAIDEYQALLDEDEAERTEREREEHEEKREARRAARADEEEERLATGYQDVQAISKDEGDAVGVVDKKVIPEAHPTKYYDGTGARVLWQPTEDDLDGRG